MKYETNGEIKIITLYYSCYPKMQVNTLRTSFKSVNIRCCAQVFFLQYITIVYEYTRLCLNFIIYNIIQFP